MSYKDLDAQLSNENKDLIITKLSEVDALLPFTIKISAKERRRVSALGKKTRGFVEAALKYSKTQPQIIPVYLDMAKKTQDMELFLQISELLSVLGPIYEKLRETSMVSGAEAYHSARIYYDAVKVAVKSGQPGSEVIAKELGSIFKRGKYKGEKNPIETPPTDAVQQPPAVTEKLAG